jgi:ABC-type hemin transport system ATPase subunit
VLLGEGCVLAHGPPREALRPELLAAAYSARFQVLPHPQSGDPVVIVDGPAR